MGPEGEMSTRHEPERQLKSEGIPWCYLHPNPAYTHRNRDYEQPLPLSPPKFRDKVVQKRKGGTWLITTLCVESSNKSFTEINSLQFSFTQDFLTPSYSVVTQNWRLQTHFQLIEFKGKVGYLAWLAVWNALQKGPLSGLKGHSI